MNKINNLEKKSDGIDKVYSKIDDLVKRGFWGTVALKFENGRPVHIQLVENIKP